MFRQLDFTVAAGIPNVKSTLSSLWLTYTGFRKPYIWRCYLYAALLGLEVIRVIVQENRLGLSIVALIQSSISTTVLRLRSWIFWIALDASWF